MKKLDFKNWMCLESLADFGFNNDNEPTQEEKDQKAIGDSKPIDTFDIEFMMEYLSNQVIGGKKGKMPFVNEVHWGEGAGSLRVWSGTSLCINIDRMGHDLTGCPKWGTKKYFQINRSGYGGHEPAVAQEIVEQLKLLDQKPLDSPSSNYQELESLVSAISEQLRQSSRNIFLYEGVKKKNDNEYIIRFGVRGHGIEAQDQQKVEENHTTVTYDKKTGMIRLINTNIESAVGGGSKWEIMPSDTDWYFFPTQPKNEIVEAIATAMRWY